MTTKAKFKCGSCGYEEEYNICSICYGKIDFPHQIYPPCPKCGERMFIDFATIKKEEPQQIKT